MKHYEITIVVRFVEKDEKVAEEWAERLHESLNKDYGEVGLDFEVNDPVEVEL